MQNPKKEKEYRKFEASTFEMPYFSLTLMDIPAPDSDKKNLKKKEMMDARKNLFQETDCLQRIIERLGKK